MKPGKEKKRYFIGKAEVYNRDSMKAELKIGNAFHVVIGDGIPKGKYRLVLEKIRSRNLIHPNLRIHVQPRMGKR